MSAIDNQKPKRNNGSLLPELFDKVEYIYPEGGTTIQKIYTYNGYVVAIIKETYVDSTKCALLVEERLPLGD